MNKTRAIAVLLAFTGIFLLGGCSYTLPNVTASEINYHRTDPLGGTQITAKNVKSDATKVTADEATFTTQYPVFSLSVTIKGYERIK